MNPIMFFCLIGAVIAMPYRDHVEDGVQYPTGGVPLFRSGLIQEDYKTGDVEYPVNHHDKFFKPSPYVFKRDYKHSVSGYDRPLSGVSYADSFKIPYNSAGFSRLYPELIEGPRLRALGRFYRS